MRNDSFIVEWVSFQELGDDLSKYYINFKIIIYVIYMCYFTF